MKHFKGNTLLMELMIVILFFALSQAIILQVFAKSHQINRDSEVLSHALMHAEDIADTLAVSSSPEEVLINYGFIPSAAGLLVLEDEQYTLAVTINRLTQTAGVLTNVTITGYQGETELFSLPASHYKGGVTP